MSQWKRREKAIGLVDGVLMCINTQGGCWDMDFKCYTDSASIASDAARNHHSTFLPFISSLLSLLYYNFLSPFLSCRLGRCLWESKQNSLLPTEMTSPIILPPILPPFEPYKPFLLVAGPGFPKQRSWSFRWTDTIICLPNHLNVHTLPYLSMLTAALDDYLGCFLQLLSSLPAARGPCIEQAFPLANRQTVYGQKETQSWTIRPCDHGTLYWRGLLTELLWEIPAVVYIIASFISKASSILVFSAMLVFSSEREAFENDSCSWECTYTKRAKLWGQRERGRWR